MSTTYSTDALPKGFSLLWYDIKEILGQGGFAFTYLAHDRNLNQKVAVKEFMPTEFVARDKTDFTVKPASEDKRDIFKWGLDRFRREAQTLAQFKHPNIVRVLSVFDQNETAYMVMEYEQGEAFDEYLKSHPPLSEAQLLAIVLPVLDGLHYVHEAGFIHRDIKPSNIYIRADGTPVLLDFGSARQVAGAKTQAMTSLVSHGYAPLEQYSVDADQQGPWTDIYSMAATLYFAVSGARPADAMLRANALLSDNADPYISLTQCALKSSYSLNFLRAIDAGLQLKPQDRPQSVKQWCAMLSPPQSDDATRLQVRSRRRDDDRKPATSDGSTPFLTNKLLTNKLLTDKLLSTQLLARILMWRGRGKNLSQNRADSSELFIVQERPDEKSGREFSVAWIFTLLVGVLLGSAVYWFFVYEALPPPHPVFRSDPQPLSEIVPSAEPEKSLSEKTLVEPETSVDESVPEVRKQGVRKQEVHKPETELNQQADIAAIEETLPQKIEAPVSPMPAEEPDIPHPEIKTTMLAMPVKQPKPAATPAATSAATPEKKPTSTPTAAASAAPSAQQAMEVLGEFKLAIEARDMKKISRLVRLNKRNRQWLSDCFANFSRIQLRVADFKYLSAKNRATATLTLINLKDLQGNAIALSGGAENMALSLEYVDMQGWSAQW